jgi:hypothetical protein
MAHEEGLVGLAILFSKVAAEGFRFCGGLGDGPSTDGIAGARDSVAAIEDLLKDAGGRLFGVEGLRSGLVAMEVKDQAVVPVFGDVDAKGCAVDMADFGLDRNGGRRGRWCRCRWGGSGRGGGRSWRVRYGSGSSRGRRCMSPRGRLSHCRLVPGDGGGLGRCACREKQQEQPDCSPWVP